MPPDQDTPVPKYGPHDWMKNPKFTAAAQVSPGSVADFLAWIQTVNPELREQYQVARQVAQRLEIPE